MTVDKDRKRVIRARMQKTGESYTAARAQILAISISKKTNAAPAPAAAVPAAPAIDYAALAGMSDDKVSAKTGRTWREWTRLLDGDGAAAL